MSVTRVSAKLWLAEPDAVSATAAEYIPVFHRWIQEGAVDGLLIDVADYGHVPDGPGVILIGHEGDHSLDLNGGPGFRYEAKRSSGDPENQISDALVHVARGAALLEADASLDEVRFDITRIRVAIADRLHAPNDDASLTQLTPAIAAAVERVFPGTEIVEQTRVGDGRRPFTVDLRLSGAVALADAEIPARR